MPESKFTVSWTETAFRDLENIIDYISPDNIDVALDKYNLIKKEALKLSSFPKRGRIVPELQAHNIITYREIIINPWRIIYRIDHNTVYVLSVFDGRRNFEDILLERFIKE